MTELLSSEKKILLAKEGFMKNSEAWDDSMAEIMAKRERIERLSIKQKENILYLRPYYRKHEKFPISGSVCKYTKQRGKCVNPQFTNPEIDWEIAGLQQ